jgi:hypothetical protein
MAGSFDESDAMPTLTRFFSILLVLGGLTFAGMLALAYLVDPVPRDMTVTIPQNRLQPRQ